VKRRYFLSCNALLLEPIRFFILVDHCPLGTKLPRIAVVAHSVLTGSRTDREWSGTTLLREKVAEFTAWIVGVTLVTPPQNGRVPNN
jgi:hypothetical protein